MIDPKKGMSAADRLLALIVLQGPPEDRPLARYAGLYELDRLGSGSDFTPFLQHAGIASLNVGFGREDEYGQYHSIYDSFDHYVGFMDSDFSYTMALAKVGGRLVMRLADADVLPFEFTRFSAAVTKYAAEVDKLADTLRAEAVERNRRLDDNAFEAVARPGETWVAPPRLDAVVKDAPGSVNDLIEEGYKAYGKSFPFSDFLVTDPYAVLTKDMTAAYYVGESTIVPLRAAEGIKTCHLAVSIKAWNGRSG